MLGAQRRHAPRTRVGAIRAFGAIAPYVDAEHFAKSRVSRRRDPQRTRIAFARKPTQLETVPAHRRADEAGDMIAPLAPVEARAAEDAPTAGLCRQVDAEIGEERPPGAGHFAAVLIEDDAPLGDEGVGDGDAEPSRKVVVAGARKPQLFLLRRARLME